ncbi:MAG: tRNA uridine-5-carboxymethylaminomethyl(34) synthesis enzyme MnmG [Erysipelotrichales bacterium]|nr:tRNA uridine-5-carboxymethylaminomethyl(34) synthesis enzyme MnmG [Erysipelotrichales bacterium]
MSKVEAVVIGAGHAGSEAALALARKGHSVVVSVMNFEYVASMPCNPSVGGPAKGVVVREIDALGGEMARNADKTALQVKLLNSSKGPGVRCLREQSDKIAYRHSMREVLLNTPNLRLKEGIAVNLRAENGKIRSVTFDDGEVVECDVVILSTGTYLSSKVMVGSTATVSGPEEQATTFDLGDAIRALGLRTFRLKTGTPPRIATSSINFRGLEPQPGNVEDEGFSYDTEKVLPIKDQALCYLTYTTPYTHKLIQDNLTRSSMYSGIVKGVGPRYCPSIEDKIVRFSDKPRHQLFLEPESLSLDTTYVQGFSTSMPHDVQDKMIHSLPGLENCEVRKYAYAIEYDAVDPLQLKPSLETKTVRGLFCAGQTNGTSGYEEAAGQGLIAGINAANYLEGKEPLILGRDESYIGVMIDDLITKGTKEPYRLFTSRAEYRLLIRHDNADQRLIKYGYEAGLIPEEKYRRFEEKMAGIRALKADLETRKILPSERLNEYLTSRGFEKLTGAESMAELAKRPGIGIADLYEIEGVPVDRKAARQAEIEVKYAGYIAKEKREAEHLKKLERMKLPEDMDYSKVEQLSLEARQKLNEVRPLSIAQASRISGVSPADLQVLSMVCKAKRNSSKE